MDNSNNNQQPQPSSYTTALPSISTRNRFTPLNPNEGETNTNTETTQSKIPKPPPIYINNLTNYSAFCAALSALLGVNSFECKSRISNVMLITKTIDGY